MKTEITAITLLTEATLKAAVTIAISQKLDQQKDFTDHLTIALRETIKNNLEQIMIEWKEATEANIGNMWLQRLIIRQSVELAQIAIKSIS